MRQVGWMLSFLLPVLAALRPPTSASRTIRQTQVSTFEVQRVRPGDGLEPQLAELLMKAFYDRPSLLSGPVAWAQRQVITANVLGDLSARLQYYERARAHALPHCGAILAVCNPEGHVCGFVDVGLPNYFPEKAMFSLPPTPTGLEHLECTGGDPTLVSGHAEPVGVEEIDQAINSGIHVSKDTSELGDGSSLDVCASIEKRAYVSNLAVDIDMRRRGIGRLLMKASEEEVRAWVPSNRNIWLEVSLDNDSALRFYKSLGYEMVAGTSGREIVRRPFHYEMIQVQRGLMRKALD